VSGKKWLHKSYKENESADFYSYQCGKATGWSGCPVFVLFSIKAFIVKYLTEKQK
jgi:hypothetical protein